MKFLSGSLFALFVVPFIALFVSNSRLIAQEDLAPLPEQAAAIEALEKAAQTKLGYELDSEHNVVALSFNAAAKKFPAAINDSQFAPIRALTELVELDLSACQHLSDSGLRHLAGLKKIRRLDLSTLDLQGDGLEQLKDLTGLRVLKLARTKLLDENLIYLREFSQLEELDLLASEIGDEGVLHCGSLKELRRINLSGTNVSDKGIASLSELTSIESLELPFGVTDNCLSSLTKLAKLQELRIGDPVDYRDRSEKKLTLAAVIDLFEDRMRRPKWDAFSAVGVVAHRRSDGQIFSLELVDDSSIPVIDDAMIGHCNECRQLERIKFHGTKVTDAGITRLNSKSLVHTLDLRGTACTAVGLAHVATIGTLRSVTVPYQTTDEGIRQVAKNQSLTELTAMCRSATDSSLEAIGMLRNLRSLRIDGMQNVTNKGVAELGNLGQLVELHFRGGKISGDGFAPIGKLTRLKRLDLSRSSLSDSELEYFADLKQLEFFNTLETDVSSQGRLSLFLELQQRSKVATISLEGGEITRDKEGRIIRVFFNGHHDESLIIDDHLALIESLTDLQEIVLYRQNISGAGFAYLSNLTKLKEVNLYRSESLDDAALKFLGGLPQLERISLYGCTKITDGALRHLTKNRALVSLGVQRTQVTMQGVSRLQSFLPNCDISQ